MAVIRPCRLDWSPELVEKFWAYHSRRLKSETSYFSFRYGIGIANFVRAAGLLNEGTRVLDFGCGRGDLARHLVAKGVICWGVDLALEAVAVSNNRLRGRAGWQGATLVSELDIDKLGLGFDVVTCVETLEHVGEKDLEPLLGRVWKLIRPGGAVVITTPHDEDLEKSMVYCPNCESEFHSVQHLRSFDLAGMTSLLERCGFAVTLCAATDFGWFQSSRWESPLDWSFRTFAGGVRDGILGLLDRLLVRDLSTSYKYARRLDKGPHLVAVACKPRL